MDINGAHVFSYLRPDTRQVAINRVSAYHANAYRFGFAVHPTAKGRPGL